MYGAASPRRRPLPPPPPCQASPPSKQPHVIRVTPPQARPFALARGTTHNTWNHKTRNHRGGVGKGNPQHREPQGPFPFPSLDTQMRIMAMMLCTMTSMCCSQCGCWWYLLLLCCSGLRHCMFIALFS